MREGWMDGWRRRRAGRGKNKVFGPPVFTFMCGVVTFPALIRFTCSVVGVPPTHEGTRKRKEEKVCLQSGVCVFKAAE